MNNIFNFFSINGGLAFGSALSVYKPYINYSWSSTYQSQEYKTDGVELVTNGDFSDGFSGWLKSASVSIVDEKAVSSGGIADYSFVVNQSDILEDGVLYKMTFDVEVISGSIRAGLGYNTTDVEVTASGSYVFIGVASQTSDEGVMIRTRTSDFIGSIDNISVQKVTEEPNKMYSKNLGKSKNSLALYSGQGVKFNGVDQHSSTSSFGTMNLDGTQEEVTFMIRAKDVTSGALWNTGYASGYAGASLQYAYEKLTLNSNSFENEVLLDIYYISSDGDLVCTLENNTWSIYINGELKASKEFVYTTPFHFSASQVLSLGSYRSSSQFCNGVLKDFFLFTRVLTPQEISLYSSNPNAFFNNVQDGTIDNCVLNMPLAEHSDYCIDYANYSEGVNLTINSTFDSGVSGWTTNANASISWDSINKAVIFQPSADHGYMEHWNSGVYLEGDLLLIEINILENTLNTSFSFGTATDNSIIASGTTGKVIYIAKVDSVYKTVRLSCGSGYVSGSITLDNITAKKLSGIHQIQNYTNSCREEAKQLPYGSQNANYKINGLGMRTDESPYFECSELFDNYGDTGWIPSGDYSIDLVAFFDTSINNLFGTQTGPTHRIMMGTYGGKVSVFIGSSQKVLTNITSIHSVTLTKEADTYSIYLNGELLIIYSAVLVIVDTFSLGYVNNRLDLVYSNPIRLFKVHNKALTQEEVTTNYNKAVAQGLLV